MNELQKHDIESAGRNCLQALRIADAIDQGTQEMPPHLDAAHYREIASWWSRQAFTAASRQ